MPDSGCAGLDWDWIAGAGPISGFAGVLAGFVFACIVFIAGDRRRNHSYTLVLFLAAFVALAAAGYTIALVAGEVSCQRAWASMVFSLAVLAVGAASVLCGLSWLMLDYRGSRLAEASERLVRRFVKVCSLSFLMFIALMMTFNASTYLLDVAATTPVPIWLKVLVWCHFAVAAAGLAAVGLDWRPPGLRTGAEAAGYAAFAVLAATAVNVFMAPLVASRPAPSWIEPQPGWLLIATTLVPLTTTVLTLLVTAAALPAEASDSTDSTAATTT